MKKKIDGFTFDSGKEAERYCELLFRQKAGEIRELKVHPEYKIDVGGAKARVYEGDFSYIECSSSELVVEDVKCKATITPMYRLKRAAMLEQYGIRIREIF